MTHSQLIETARIAQSILRSSSQQIPRQLDPILKVLRAGKNRAVTRPNCPVTKYSPANTGVRTGQFLPELPARSNCPAARLYKTGSGQTQFFSMARKTNMTTSPPSKHLAGKP